MSVIDDIKAELAAALAGAETVGADIAARLMAATGHNVTEAIGHVIDVVSTHQADVRAVLEGITQQVETSMANILAQVTAALPAAAPPAAQPAPQSGASAG